MSHKIWTDISQFWANLSNRVFVRNTGLEVAKTCRSDGKEQKQAEQQQAVVQDAASHSLLLCLDLALLFAWSVILTFIMNYVFTV